MLHLSAEIWQLKKCRYESKLQLLDEINMAGRNQTEEEKNMLEQIEQDLILLDQFEIEEKSREFEKCKYCPLITCDVFHPNRCYGWKQEGERLKKERQKRNRKGNK
jgi:hypothetical protein